MCVMEELILANKVDYVMTDSTGLNHTKSSSYVQFICRECKDMTNSGPQIKRSTFCGIGCAGLNGSFQKMNYNNYSLRGAIKSLRGANKSLRGANMGANKSLRRAIKSLRGANKSLQGAKRYIFVECNNFFEIINITVTYLCYNFLERILILSGDIELNPGPIVNNNVLSDPNISTFRCRLNSYGLRALDVGGGGDCFFRSVLHQLYGDPSHHLEIRTTGVQYLNNHPECFIESNIETSWLGYLINMSLQGTWAGHIIIQAVANAFNLNINIIESEDRFSATTLVQSNSGNDPREVFLGHIGEIHVDRHGQLTLKQLRLSVLNEVHTNSQSGPRLYVSTCPILQDNETETCQSNSISCSEYMKNYRAK